MCYLKLIIFNDLFNFPGAINPVDIAHCWSEQAKVTNFSPAGLFQTTGLVGLAVSHSPHEVSVVTAVLLVMVDHVITWSHTILHASSAIAGKHGICSGLLLSIWVFCTPRSWRRWRACRGTPPTGSTRSSWSARGSTTSKRWVSESVRLSDAVASHTAGVFEMAWNGDTCKVCFSSTDTNKFSLRLRLQQKRCEYSECF